MKKIFPGIAVLIALLFGAHAIRSSTLEPVLHSLTLTNPSGTPTQLQVEWATTPAAQQRGLMHRQTVDRGMLFMFTDNQPRMFWMKNTLVPLDIMFFDASGRYVSSMNMLPCTADPCMRYPSGGPANYALEMPAGFIGQHQIAQGWTMKISQ